MGDIVAKPINSIVPSQNLEIVEIEKIKSTETAKLMASFNQLLKLQASILGEMKNSGELITIPRTSFVNIFHDAILNAKDEDQRKLLREILDKIANLSKNVQ